ncbi:hypothetical protein [Methylocystis sp. Sn-Cys]|uniref:hypothetical protein n=1 Tax=Methylocystis sp. Sn-Cys TaxID=1701263 RepID=UPI0019210F20|nr:hypothetical protein [Methylocystis sp. Sn-Cys]MBL1258403.1 hypothetical protein [Methylocystis sp. Sn-Cys]
MTDWAGLGGAADADRLASFGSGRLPGVGRLHARRPVKQKRCNQAGSSIGKSGAEQGGHFRDKAFRHGERPFQTNVLNSTNRLKQK